MPDPTPTEIQLHQKSRCLEIAFDNGQRFELPCEYLRVFSTSAEVQAALERGEVIIGKENVNITKIEPVGSYAINLQFDDGHDTGIFAWSTLYDLGLNYEKNWQDYLKERKQAGFGLYSVPQQSSATPANTAEAEINIKILYFVTLVKKFGKDAEQCQLPSSVNNISGLLAWLHERGGVWEATLKDDKLNITVNKQFAKLDTKIHNGDEIAIVPADAY